MEDRGRVLRWSEAGAGADCSSTSLAGTANFYLPNLHVLPCTRWSTSGRHIKRMNKVVVSRDGRKAMRSLHIGRVPTKYISRYPLHSGILRRPGRCQARSTYTAAGALAQLCSKGIIQVPMYISNPHSCSAFFNLLLCSSAVVSAAGGPGSSRHLKHNYMIWATY